MSKNELMVIEKAEDIRVVARTNPFKVERLEAFAPEGASAYDILRLMQSDSFYYNYASIFVNGYLVDRTYWEDAYPRKGDIVIINFTPKGGGGGGGGKNPLKAVMTIGIIAASFYFGVPVGQFLIREGIDMAIGGTLLSTIVGRAVIGGIGMLVSNALIPPKSPTSPTMPTLSGISDVRDSPTLFIEGARNAERPFGTVPLVLGVHKHVPPLGAKVYTEIVGNDQHLRMLVIWGYGRLKIEEIKIGETLLQEFDGVQIQTVEGVAGQSSLSLFPDFVISDNFSVLLKQTEGWSTRTSETEADELSVDIIYARGLVTFDDDGNRNDRSVTFEMQYRENGTSGSWLNPNISAGTINNATVQIGYTYSTTRSYWKTTGNTRGTYVNWVTETYDTTGTITSPITDTGAQQIITTGIGTLPANAKITAKVTGGGAVIDAVQVIIDGLDSAGSPQQETLPAFTEDTPGTVTGSSTFSSVTQITIPAMSSAVLEVTNTNNKSSTVRYGYRWAVGTRGTYDVRIRRTTSDSSSTRIFDELSWVTLRTITNEDPDNFSDADLAKSALVIKATDQLSSVIDDLNAKVSSYVLDWNGATWAEAISSNPASLFRHVLQSSAMAIPLADARIDLTTLQTWHTFCSDNGFEFNQIRDYQSSVWETLVDICIAGRAMPVQIDGKWSVVIDKTQTIPTQHFTNKNSWGFEAEKDFTEIPHALRARFANRDTDWKQDELIVYDDGYTSANATRFEEIDAIGMTDSDHVWKYCRFNLVQMRLRPEKWHLSTDFEYLVSKRGDLVLITHDVLLVGLASGRIKELQTASNGDVTGFTSDETLTMEAGKTYGVSIRTRDDIEITRQVVLDVGDQTTIVLDTVIDVADVPVEGDLFAFGELASETIEGIILGLESQSNLSARLTIAPYSSAIYTADTGTIPAFETKITGNVGLPDVVIVGSPRTDESILRLGSGNTLIPRIGITHEPIDDEFEAIINAQIRLTGSEQSYSPVTISFQSKTEIIIEEVEQGETYDIRLQWSSHKYLKSGAWSYASNVTVIGQTSVPSPLSNLTISAFSGNAILRWDALEDLDVRFGGTIQFRHSHELDSDDASWSESVSIGTASKGSDQIVVLPLKAGTYLARVIDKGGRYSTVTKVDTKQASLLTFAAATNITEEPTFSGTHTNTIAIDSILKLIGTDLIDSWNDVDDIVNWDSEGGIVSSGTYDFASGHDLTTVTKTRITTDINVINTNVIDLIDGWAGNVDDRESWDGDVSGEADARVQVRVTDDDPLLSAADFSVWNNLESAEFINRGLDYRIQLTTSNSSVNPIVSKLQVNSEVLA